jgi:hypothetical protein
MPMLKHVARGYVFKAASARKDLMSTIAAVTLGKLSQVPRVWR